MPESMNLKDINKWWKRGLEKERLRQTNTPSSKKGSWVVPTDFSNLAPHGKNRRRSA